MNCQFCQAPLEYKEQNLAVECWTCNNHGSCIVYYLYGKDNSDLAIEMFADQPINEFFYRISYDSVNHILEIHNTQSKKWNCPYSVVMTLTDQPTLNISPDNLENKLKNILIFS